MRLKYILLDKCNKVLKKRAEKRKKLPREIVYKCIDYYEKHDVFLKLDRAYFDKKQKLLKRELITHEDFHKFIDDTKGNPFTSFTYFYQSIFGLWFEKSALRESERKDETFRVTGADVYVKLDLHEKGVADRFSKLLSRNQGKRSLTIDLRDCVGGYVDECVSICNLLLPKCRIFTQVFKDKVVSYMSDERHHVFEKVNVLVNNHTASSAEILACSLEKNLPMCSIVGGQTVGKHFGQDFFINKKYRYIFSVVSFYWKV